MPASWNLPLGALFGFLLCLARVAGVVAFLPLPGLRAGVHPIRLVLALALTGSLFPLWGRAAPSSVGEIAVWAAAESAFGVAVGLAVAMLLELAAIAGQAAGFQAGYSYASTIDPSTQADSSVLVVLAQLAAGLLFFTLGLDRELVRVLAASMTSAPPGGFAFAFKDAEAVWRLGETMFSAGLRLALPVVGLLLMADLALALMARVHSQLQLLSLAFPLKMMLGAAVMAAVCPLYVPVFRAAARRTFAALAGLVDGG